MNSRSVSAYRLIGPHNANRLRRSRRLLPYLGLALAEWQSLGCGQTLQIHTSAGPVTSVHLQTDDGPLFVGVSGGEVIRRSGLWLESQASLARFSEAGSVLLSMSADGTLAVASNYAPQQPVLVLDIVGGRVANRIAQPGPALPDDPGIWSVALQPDGGLVAACGRTLTLWRLPSGLLAATRENPRISVLRWTPSGALLVAGTLDGSILIFDPTALDAPRDVTIPLASDLAEANANVASPEPPLAAAIVALSATSDSRVLAATNANGELIALDLASGLIVNRRQAHRRALEAYCEFTSDGQWLVTASEDGSVKRWRTATWELDRTWLVRGNATCMAVSQSGRTIAVGLGNLGPGNRLSWLPLPNMNSVILIDAR